MAESVARLFEEFSDSHQFLKEMTAEQKQQLVTMASVRTLANRQVIATLDAPTDGIYFIEAPTDGQLTWLYESCRVAFFPSLHESFPLRVLESLMHGKPAVLSDIAIMREIHPHGRFASPNDVEAWKSFLLQMHGKELPKQATFQAKKWQWEKRADELARQFKELEKR